MRKISLFLTLAASLLMTTTGCLKDKGFEDQEYGIQIVESRGVAFIQAGKSPVIVGITGQAAPLTVPGPFITIEGDGAATSDVKVDIQFNDNVVTDQGLTPLPAGTYSVNTMSPVIESGTRNTQELEITVTNTDQLDPNISYGIGFTITSVDQGYNIAANMQNVVIGFTIKNKYDGVYRLQGYHNRAPYTFPYDTEIHLVTNGPNEVYFYWPEVNSQGHPIGVGPGSMSWYGPDVSPVIVFNTTTDLVTDVYNAATAVPITMFTGAGAGVSRFEQDLTTPTNTKMYVYWNYSNNPLRAFFDTLTYIGPRP